METIWQGTRHKIEYIMRILKPMISCESLITIYHSYFHSILRYGILFWGNTPISKDIFKIQKRTVRIITDKNRRESFRELFKNLKILTLTSQYIISVLSFVIENKELFTSNKDIHNFNTRHSLDFHLPSTHLSIVQRGVIYPGSKIFNSLPTHIKSHAGNSRNFIRIIKKYLIENVIYNLEEFYQLTLWLVFNLHYSTFIKYLYYKLVPMIILTLDECYAKVVSIIILDLHCVCIWYYGAINYDYYYYDYDLSTIKSGTWSIPAESFPLRSNITFSTSSSGTGIMKTVENVFHCNFLLPLYNPKPWWRTAANCNQYFCDKQRQYLQSLPQAHVRLQ